MNQEDLNTITELSHRFGAPDFVKGGGGNTSVKNQEQVWVKPSGTTLAGMTPDSFIGLSRERLKTLYTMDIPADSSKRESRVQEIMREACLEADAARPSVEAPLHDILEGRFVVHTHAVLVNGMTCSLQGEAVCRDLFPEALWVPYIDPGFILCMDVRRRIDQYSQMNGHSPRVLILENHGIFVSGDTLNEIVERYEAVLEPLRRQYDDKGLALELRENPVSDPLEDEVLSFIRETLGDQAASVLPGGSFQLAEGPISPDHIVYSKSFPYRGPLTDEGLRAYQSKWGYSPRILDLRDQVVAVAPNEKQARLALDLARDGALLVQLADAFGGIQYLGKDAREFIEQWEVEAYRQKQMSGEE